MALKPTIFKANIALADSDRNVFEQMQITLAQHPSETLERLSARLLAYCFQWQPELEFTRGLSTNDEPDIWRRSAAGEIEQWIEIGQPEEPRLRKARGRAKEVVVYSYSSGANTWWKINEEAMQALSRTQFLQLDWDEVQAVAREIIQRTMNLNVSIVGGVLYIDNGDGSCSIEPRLLHASDQD